MDSLVDAIASSNAADILGLAAARPGDSNLVKFQRLAAMKHASRASSRQLRLPSHGGGPGRPQCFLFEKAEADDQDVEATARVPLARLDWIEKRSAGSANMKRAEPRRRETKKNE